jgi:hypothetical protein
MSHFSTFSQQKWMSGVLLIGIPVTFIYFRPMNHSRQLKCMLKGFGLLSVCLVLAGHLTLFGAKGGVKEKKGVVLKFDGFASRITVQPSASLRLGGTYKGSFNNIIDNGQGTSIQSIITYQKGNTTFIYPYKHRVMQKFKTPEPSKY